MNLLIPNFILIHFDSIPSTNLFAKKLINGPKDLDNTIIVADKQTNGQTTKATQKWKSPIGNLYVTFVIKLTETQEKYFHELSFITALSVLEVITEKYKNVDIKIKWPNDILLCGKKICGILIEKEKNFAIIGIGINLISHPNTKDMKYPATNLKTEGFIFSRKEIITELSKKLVTNINLCNNKTFFKIIEKINPHLYKLNENIIFIFNNEKFSGKFIGLNNDGALIIKTSTGIQTFLSGEFSKENF